MFHWLCAGFIINDIMSSAFFASVAFRYVEEESFLLMAAYLDPRFKDMPYLDFSERSTLNSNIRQQMFRVYLSTSRNSRSESNNAELGKCKLCIYNHVGYSKELHSIFHNFSKWTDSRKIVKFPFFAIISS